MSGARPRRFPHPSGLTHRRRSVSRTRQDRASVPPPRRGEPTPAPVDRDRSSGRPDAVPRPPPPAPGPKVEILLDLSYVVNVGKGRARRRPGARRRSVRDGPWVARRFRDGPPGPGPLKGSIARLLAV